MEFINNFRNSFSRDVLHYKSERNSSIEVLRIIAILFVLIHHWTIKMLTNMPGDEWLYLFLETLTVVGKIGVDIFFVISGFVMCRSTKFSFNKLLRICLEVFFYTAGWSIANIIMINNGYLTSADMGFEVTNAYSYFSYFWLEFNNFLGSGGYWFAATYLFVFLIAPFLNVVMHKIAAKGQIVLVGFLFVLCGLLPSIGISGNANFPILGIACYICGCFIGLHPDYFKKKRWVGLSIALIACFIQMITSYFLYKAHFNDAGNPWYTMAINWQTGAFAYTTYLSAVGFVIFFGSFSFKVPFINLIASTTYGIYLFHNGAATPCIDKVFNFKNVFLTENTTNALVASFFAYVFGLFIVGCFIDLIRQFLIEKPLFKYALNKLPLKDIKLMKQDD